MRYVVCATEHLRDGVEHGVTVVSSLKEVEETLDRWGNGFAANNTTFCVFELGKEVRIQRSVEETPQPSIKKTVFKISGG